MSSTASTQTDLDKFLKKVEENSRIFQENLFFASETNTFHISYVESKNLS
jgi:hypothetical protein